ncbi:MAG: dihydrofolate reductase [Candidatus Kerfeldbacteria bacterium]
MRQPIVSSIVAVAKQDRAIGSKNKLLWEIPEDMQYFRKITAGHPVIMGQLTFESIGMPLPKRLNIVLSLDKNYKADGVTIASSIEEGIKIAKENDQEEIFVIGGASIYKQTIDLIDRLYVTEVEGEYEADTFFPEYSQFTKVVSERESSDEKYKYKFLVLEK